MNDKPRFTLVNIPSSANAYHNFLDFVAVFPPIGITSIAAVLEKIGCDVSILDADAHLLSIEETVEELCKLNPEYLGFTTMTATMDITGQVIRAFKQRMPSVKIIAGGPHTSAIPQKTLEDFPEIDIAVIGEGDESIVEIMDAISNDGSLAKIDGIAFRDGDRIIVTPNRAPIKDLGKTPIPAYHLLDFSLYKSYGWNNWVSGYRAPLGVIFTGRGCFGKCNFCASHCVFGHGIRFYPIERIKKEIDLFVKEYDIRVLYFQDDTFTANRKIVNEICDFLIERGYNKRLEIMVSARVDSVHAETLKKMRKAGIRWICFGVESGSQPILDRMGKNITIDKIKSAYKMSNEAGLFVAGNFMIGHINETWETAMATIDLACELDQDYISFAIAIPFPGTELYDHCIKNNIPLPNWNNFGSVNSPPIPLNKGLDADKLIELRMISVNHFFKRPSYILRMLWRFNAMAVIKDFVKMYLAIRKERKSKRF